MSLVTVAITTYNSSKYILETLESIISQTYPEIELIISDDASQDDTLEIVQSWIKKEHNHKRFSRLKVIETSKNSGVAANANRALNNSRGEWIKYLGADDTLMPDCIKDNLKYITDNPEVRALFSKVSIYRDNFEKANFIRTTPDTPVTVNSIIWPERTAISQYRMLLLQDRIHFSPSAFLHRETLQSVGGFDERFRLLEDYPLWLNLTKNGNKLYFMDKLTVNYRSHAKAINNTGFNYLVNPNYFKQKEVRRVYTYPYLPTGVKLSQQFTWCSSQIFRWDWLNKNKIPNRLLYLLLTVYLNPFKYFLWLRKQINKKLKSNEFYN